MLFLTPDNDFAGKDQVYPFCILSMLSYCALISYLFGANIWRVILVVYLWQAISLEEIKKETSKYT